MAGLKDIRGVSDEVLEGLAHARHRRLPARRNLPSCPAVVRPVLVGSGEQGEERADPESFLGGVPELAVVPDGVPGAPPGAGAGDVTA